MILSTSICGDTTSDIIIQSVCLLKIKSMFGSMHMDNHKHASVFCPERINDESLRYDLFLGVLREYVRYKLSNLIQNTNRKKRLSGVQ